VPSRPWFKFYPSNWRGESTLRLCSAAARGLWIECMCLMHEAEPYGHLKVNGRPVTEAQLANLTGIPQDQITLLLGELGNAGVFSRNSEGVVYSRRMTRDAKREAEGRKHGKEGGNPALKPPLNPTLKGQDNGEGSPRSQRIEPRDTKKILEGLVPKLTGRQQLDPAQRRAIWLGKVSTWLQRKLPEPRYAAWLDAFAKNEKWAKDLAEQADREMRDATARMTGIGAA
jgi:hypothetical protein